MTKNNLKVVKSTKDKELENKEISGKKNPFKGFNQIDGKELKVKFG